MKKWVKPDSQFATGSRGRVSARIADQTAEKKKEEKKVEKVVPKARKKGDSLNNRRR